MEAWGGRETRPLTEEPKEEVVEAEPVMVGEMVRTKEGYWMGVVPFASDEVERCEENCEE